MKENLRLINKLKDSGVYQFRKDQLLLWLN